MFADPLVWMRAVHFAACATLAGTLVFACFMAHDLIDATMRGAQTLRARTMWTLSLALATAVVSAAAWFLHQARSMAAFFPDGTESPNTTWIVLTQTRFGQVTALRGVIALVLAVCLYAMWRTHGRNARTAGIVGIWLAATYLGSLPFIGHAGAATGSGADLHLAADILHVVAAAAWGGGLVGLVLLLTNAHASDAGWREAARTATRRFSCLAIVAVVVVASAGFANAWFLAGTAQNVLETDYGHVLLVKIGLFAIVLGFAGVNRFVLTPRLGKPAALRWLRLTCLAELALALAILFAAALLGTLPPPAHVH